MSTTASNLTPEEEPPKSIDIFQHLRLNLKSTLPNCRCTVLPDLYCIPCKTTVCRRCTYEDHKKHLVVSKKNTELNQEDVNEIFQEVESVLNSNEIYTKCELLKNNLIKDIENFAQSLIEKINEMKEKKKEEIEKMFENLDFFINTTKEQVQKTKQNLINYHEQFKNFFCYQQENEDETNTIFLMNYDMLSIIYQKTQDIKNIASNLETDLGNYKILEEYQRLSISNQMDKILFDEYNIEHISEEFKEKNLNITPDIKKDTIVIDEKYIPFGHFRLSSERLNFNHFKDIEDRITKYTKEIESFQSKVYNSVVIHQSYKEIEKDLNLFENSKQKGADSLFSKRQPTALTGSLTSRTRMTNKDSVNGGRIHLDSKDEVRLNDPILNKYFACMTIDLYGTFFRMMTKELQSSHADLLIKLDQNEEETDFAKINEGTNVLVIYDKKNNKLTKKKIPLTKNPYGYTSFPTGCRCLMMGDKIYITGGKNEKQVYSNVLIYDRKTDKLKRIMDMVKPRCYHTMIFNDAFETIMVFGGENQNSVEIFDPLVNRWIPLPSMNYPRANVFFQFDKPRGFLYTLFGNEGKIVDNKYSDVIEYLDLTQVKNGWMKLDYYNRSETKLKTHLNVFPLSNSLLLAYGGESGRNPKKVVCVINLAKGEITKIDKQLAEQLKIESKKSVTFKSIVYSLNLK